MSAQYAAERAQLDITHSDQTGADHAALRARVRDIEQELMLDVERAVKRALLAMEGAGALDRWMQRGQWPVRCTAEEVVGLGGEEIATNAVEMLTAYRSADARDAFKMED